MSQPYLAGSSPEFVEAADVQIVAKNGEQTFPAHHLFLARCCSCFSGGLGLQPAAAAAAAAAGSKRRRPEEGEAEAAAEEGPEARAVLQHDVDVSAAAVQLFLTCVYNYAPGAAGSFAAVDDQLKACSIETYCEVLHLAERFGFGSLSAHLMAATMLAAHHLPTFAALETALRLADELNIQPLRDLLSSRLTEPLAGQPESGAWQDCLQRLVQADAGSSKLPALVAGAARLGLSNLLRLCIADLARQLGNDLTKSRQHQPATGSAPIGAWGGIGPQWAQPPAVPTSLLAPATNPAAACLLRQVDWELLPQEALLQMIDLLVANNLSKPAPTTAAVLSWQRTGDHAMAPLATQGRRS